jgi:site-specific DNA recombinase
MTPATPLRCAIYARVSTDDQAERYGLSSQLTELRALAARRGYTIIGEYIDDGISGAVLERPKLAELRALVRNRGVEVVLAHTTDRISRELVHLLLVTDEVRRSGARLEYVTHTPDDTAEGQFREQVLGAVAQLERAKIRERTNRGRREKARRGLVPSGPVPLGYRRDPRGPGGYVIDETGAEWVRRMFTWLLDGASLREIGRRLDAQGLRPPRGRYWAPATVRRMLMCETYVGQAYYDRRAGHSGGSPLRDRSEWITIAVPPIISQATWDRAQVQLHRNVALRGGRPPTRVYLLGGLLVCGACGRRMYADSEHGVRLVYRCAGRTDRDRSARCRAQLLAARVHEPVWRALVAVLRDPDLLTSTAKASRLGIDAARVDASTQAAELSRTLAQLSAKRERLLGLFLDGRLAREQFDAHELPLAAEQARLERELAGVQAQLRTRNAEADVHAAVVRYCRLIAAGLDRLDPRGRQALVRRLVTRIVVHPNGLEVEGALPLGTLRPDPEPAPTGGDGGGVVLPVSWRSPCSWRPRCTSCGATGGRSGSAPRR